MHQHVMTRPDSLATTSADPGISVLTRRLSLWLLAGWVAGAFIGFASPMRAHSASYYYYMDSGLGIWPVDHSEPYYIRDNFPSSAYGSRINDSRAHWNAVGGDNEVDFTYAGITTGTGNFWNPCSVNNSMVSMRSDLPAGYLALTNTCNSPTYITRFHVGISPNANWYSGTGTPLSNEWDLRSIVTHEWGHVTGFFGHFINTADTCAGIYEDVNTMCEGSPSRIGTTYLRSTETHDIHTFLGAY